MNDTLRLEADQLLYGHGLLHLLEEYGVPTITGSRYLDLMVWRDLDLYVTIDQFSRLRLYELLDAICSTFQPKWIEAKEEKDFPPGCDRSFFLGFETEVLGTGLWNVDIWFMDAEYIAERQAYLDRIRLASEETRAVIHRLKQGLCQSPEYGQSFFSVDVYNSVLDDGVATIEEFHQWLRKRC
ncbi:MAG: hypothetical protein ACM3ZQ_01140 [Bacillota bacterium]